LLYLISYENSLAYEQVFPFKLELYWRYLSIKGPFTTFSIDLAYCTLKMKIKFIIPFMFLVACAENEEIEITPPVLHPQTQPFELNR
jgi:hypothetical protein